MKTSIASLSSFKKVTYAITTLSFWLMLSNPISAQNSWIGGTPGAETEWSNPKNWSENKVPDWRDDTVIISDVSSQSGYFPIVTKKVNEISHLRLEGGATLTINKNGKLKINGAYTFNYGIFNGGSIVNYGYVSIENSGLSPLENPNKNIINRGAFALYDETHDIQYLAVMTTASEF